MVFHALGAHAAVQWIPPPLALTLPARHGIARSVPPS